MDRSIDLEHLLRKASHAKYVDLRRIDTKEVDIALRRGSFEVNEHSGSRIVCRAVQRGYGVSSTNKLDKEQIDQTLDRALRQASSIDGDAQLLPVPVEKGEFEHPLKKEFDLDEVDEFMLDLRRSLEMKLGQIRSNIELVFEYIESDSRLATSEGTAVREKASYIDLLVYLVVREGLQGYASQIVGGQGGLEVIENRDWDQILDDLVMRARHSARAHQLSPLERGKKFKVILDSEAAGALAHEVAHMLEADQHEGGYFRNLGLSEDLEIVDNPLLPGAYGSFVWDDEGVRGRKKVLVGRGEVGLLHTRLTAKEGDEPGNAHGVGHIPKPAMSNVYIRPSDWKTKEIFEETRFGIYVKGVVRAETDVSTGRFELMPEIAYLVEKSEVKTPIRNLRVTDSLRNIVRQIDAIGCFASLRPNIEKGFCISEGGPYIRLNDVHCA